MSAGRAEAVAGWSPRGDLPEQRQTAATYLRRHLAEAALVAAAHRATHTAHTDQAAADNAAERVLAYANAAAARQAPARDAGRRDSSFPRTIHEELAAVRRQGTTYRSAPSTPPPPGQGKDNGRGM